MVRRITQFNASSWLAVTAYAVGAAAIFFNTFWAAPIFSNLDDSYPLPIRAVMFLGPFGWLAVAFLAALATLTVPSTSCRLISAILFLCLALGVMCTVAFTSLDRPTIIAPAHP